MRIHIVLAAAAVVLAAAPVPAQAGQQTVSVTVLNARADFGIVNFERTGGRIGARLVSGPPGATVHEINAAMGNDRAYSVQIALPKGAPKGSKVVFALTAPSPKVCFHRGFWDRGLGQGWDLKPGDVTGVPSCR